MSRACSGGVQHGCPSTHAIKCASNATSPQDISRSSSGGLPWREDYGPQWSSFPIARLRYTAAEKMWTLYWRDRNLRFHIYDVVAASPSIEDLLTEIDRDPTGIFWG